MKARVKRFNLLSVVGMTVGLHVRFNTGTNGAAGGSAGSGAGGSAASSAAAGAAGAGAGAAGGAAATQAPAGYRLVKDADYATMEGHAKVGEGFSQRASQYGWKGPEDLDALKPVFDTAKSDPNRLKLMLAALTPAEREEAKDNVEGGMSFEDAFEAAKAELKMEGATEKHADARKGVPAFIQAQIDEILGEDAADELSKEQYRYMARGLLEEMRDAALEGKDDAAKAPYVYPKGHPLSGHRLVPFNAQNTAAAWTKLKELRTKITGKTLADLGDAANKGGTRRGTPAGAPKGGGSQTQGKDDVGSARDHIRGVIKTGLQKAGVN